MQPYIASWGSRGACISFGKHRVAICSKASQSNSTPNESPALRAHGIMSRYFWKIAGLLILDYANQRREHTHREHFRCRAAIIIIELAAEGTKKAHKLMSLSPLRRPNIIVCFAWLPA